MTTSGSEFKILCVLVYHVQSITSE